MIDHYSLKSLALRIGVNPRKSSNHIFESFMLFGYNFFSNSLNRYRTSRLLKMIPSSPTIALNLGSSRFLILKIDNIPLSKYHPLYLPLGNFDYLILFHIIRGHQGGEIFTLDSNGGRSPSLSLLGPKILSFQNKNSLSPNFMSLS